MPEQPVSQYELFIHRLDLELQSANCSIWRAPQISDTREVAILATRIEWNLVRLPVHLLVDYINCPNRADFVALFEEGLIYCKMAFSGGSGLKIWVSSFAMVPCICCDEFDPEIARYVTNRQHLWRKHIKFWDHGFDYFPVLHCLKTNETLYWKGGGFDIAGSLIHPFARKFVQQSIVAASSNQ